MKKNTKVKKKVSVIIPTFNEAATIAKLIQEIKKLKKQFPIEIIVIDAHSSDNTVALAKKEGVIVIRRSKKYGKGADFWYAAKKATGEYIVQIDADYQFMPSEIPLFIQAMEKGAHVAIAHRINHSEAPLIRTLGNIIFSPITSLLVGKKIYDVVAGFKAFKTPVLLSMDLQEDHFGYEGEVVVKTVRMGYTLAQIPVTYKPRLTGKSSVSPLRDGFLTFVSLAKARILPLPEKTAQ